MRQFAPLVVQVLAISLLSLVVKLVKSYPHIAPQACSVEEISL